MKTVGTRVKFWWLLTGIVVLVLVLFLATAVSANGPPDELRWVTVCHVQPGETPQGMVIYWSALDKCLSHFGDFMGSCAAHAGR